MLTWLPVSATVLLHTGAGRLAPLFLAVLLVVAAALPRLTGALGGRRRTRRRAMWVLGVAWLAVALLPPLEHLAERSLAAHMAQHVLLLFVVSPLLVAADPVGGTVRGLPVRARQRAAGALSAARRAGRLPPVVLTVAFLHVAVLLVWHVPGVYTAALASPLLHGTEHAQFLAVGMAFWWSAREVSRRRRPAELAAAWLGLAAVVGTGIGLGLLMTFATEPWYPSYPGVPEWGLSALADQQLAGAVMWAGGGPAYLMALLTLVVGVLRSPQGTRDDALRPTASRAR